MAKKINVTRAYLSQIENNKREPGLAFLKKVAEFFSIPIALLLIDENNPDSDIFKELNNILSELLSLKLSKNS
ncbi:MAG: helix-turn-helix domain-containing protein [Candidatus Anammoxibacter sp.]